MIRITDLAITGKSVGHHNGMAVLVDQGLPGDLVECQLTQVKRNYALGRMLRLLESSPLRIEPRCHHFAICGGCTWQNLTYPDQVAFKSRFVSEALARIGKLDDFTVESPIASAEEFFYRNKMEYSFGGDGHSETAGLHVRGRFDAIFELGECLLQSERSVMALKIVREQARKLAIPFYDLRTGAGELRFLVVREGKLTGDLMLNLVTFNREFAGREELFDAIIREVEGLTSLFHTINGRKAHVAVGEEVISIFGEPYLREKVGNLTFCIAPFSFFQTNTRQTEVLYQTVKEHARPQRGETILDLFCGCGTIGLFLATDVGSVLGMEIDLEAIKMAKLNASLNGIRNVEFVAGDARKLLAELHASGRRFDTVVTDPPRAGMEQTAIRRLARLHPNRVVAVSCNPATLARDLGLFRDAGYRAIRVTPVDMFPQTAHIETVVTLVPVATEAA